MFWTLSFQLLPGENILEDSTERTGTGIKAAYSVFLTNKRAIFRFDGLGSSLTQSFFYNEISSIHTRKRLFVTYLEIRTGKKDSLLNVADAEYWADRITRHKESSPSGDAGSKYSGASSPERKKRELLDMLTVLRKNGLLTDSELEEKIRMLDSLRF